MIYAVGVCFDHKRAWIVAYPDYKSEKSALRTFKKSHDSKYWNIRFSTFDSESCMATAGMEKVEAFV